MSTPRIRRLVALGGEIVLAVGLCLVSYALFVYLLGVIFPSSTGLRALLGAAPPGGPGRTGAQTARALLGSGSVADAEEAPALLTVLSQDVTTKRAEGVAWVPARTGAALRGRDGVQTARRGAARIDFDEENRLRLGPNTLVIIRETVREIEEPARQASVLMLEGELWADVAPGSDGATMALQVHTPGGVARVAPSPGDQAARLRISVDDRQVSKFAVYSGEMKLKTREGSVRIGEDQFVAVDTTGAISTPRLLPPSPSLASPLDEARLTYRDTPPAVTFAWEAVEGATGYRFVLAKDPSFQRVVKDAITAEPGFRQQGLRPGRYYWRVASRAGDAEGLPGSPRSLTVISLEAGPRLDVGLPPPVVHGDRFLIEGTTDPGARVWVSDAAVAVDARGRFRHEIALRPGMNMIVIEAIGPDGASAYRSAIVNAKP